MNMIQLAVVLIGLAFARTSVGLSLDLCFLVDVTGSMSPQIDAVRTQINNIVNGINPPFNDVRVAFVGYRDCDDLKQYEIFDFSSSVSAFKNFVQGVSATGGGDLPEDVAGALNKAKKLDWRMSNSVVKILFHAADAPCHETTPTARTKRQAPLRPFDPSLLRFLTPVRDCCAPCCPQQAEQTSSIIQWMNTNNIYYFFFGPSDPDINRMLDCFDRIYDGNIPHYGIGVSGISGGPAGLPGRPGGMVPMIGGGVRGGGGSVAAELEKAVISAVGETVKAKGIAVSGNPRLTAALRPGFS